MSGLATAITANPRVPTILLQKSVIGEQVVGLH
jgi:hypothetical protein